jgi:hypothetical protein
MNVLDHGTAYEWAPLRWLFAFYSVAGPCLAGWMYWRVGGPSSHFVTFCALSAGAWIALLILHGEARTETREINP